MKLRNPRTASLLFWAVLAMPLQPDRTAAQAFTIPWEAVADAVVQRMDLQPGETVLLVARAGDFEALVPLLRTRVSAAGATDLGAVEIGGNPIPGSPTTDFVAGLAGLEGPELVAALDAVDLGVMLPGATPADAVYGALQERLWQDQGRTIHFHWAGAYGLDGVLLPLSDDINRWYVDVLLKTDYAALSASQEACEPGTRHRPGGSRAGRRSGR